MKNLFIAVFMLVANVATAQIVTIPDANFKTFLLNFFPRIDTNNDGEIQLSEAQAVDSLNIYDGTASVINSLSGLESFTNLIYLQASVSSPVINTAGLSKLKRFNVFGAVETLDLSGCTALENLRVECYKLVTLNIANCEKVKDLYISYCNRLTTIIKSTNDSLKTAILSFNPSLVHIDFSGIRNLQQLHINIDSTIESLNVNGCSSLRMFSITAMPNNGPIEPLDILDLSSCINLTAFAANFYQIRYLNIKNGRTIAGSDFRCDGNANVMKICADEFEIPALIQHRRDFYFDTYGFISSYCTFFPGGNYNTVKGKMKIDLNSNGCNDNDNGMQQAAIKIQDAEGNSAINYTAAAGDYAHYAYKGNFTITPYFPYPYFIINPATASVTFDTANNLTAIKDFCIQPNGIHNDLEITFIPVASARPGFNAAYTLVYKNRGTTTLSGNVTVNFDNSKMNFVSASENVTTQSTGQLTWNYNNLQPFESKTITVTFNLLPPPVNNIGDTILYLAAITPSANDETAFDNSFVLPQRVIGSFDPNDKTCIEGSKLDISKIGDYLHYQIRFQNEGTDTAFNIVVADTLSNNLDWNTFEFIGSSHTADVKLTNNKLEFFFQNINLPYKTINEPASNGWVAFKIKPKPSVVIGDSLNNSAAIYFDFNLPVITNTATTIVSTSSSPVPVKLEYFSANKKEMVNQLNWKASCTYGNAAFVIERSNDGIAFKAIGNITATALRCQLPFSFTDNNPAAGKNYYRLKISDADGKSFYSKTLVVGNNKAGIEITAIANNTVYLTSNKQQTVIIKVIAADGREVFNQKQTISAGNNNIKLALNNVSGGIYSLVIYSGNSEIFSKRFTR